MKDYESRGPNLPERFNAPSSPIGLKPPTRGADKLRTGSATDNSPRRPQHVQPNNGIIYAIIDLKADAIAGGLQLHRADAAAIRTFGDIATDDKTTINKHVEDYELRRLGYIDLDNQIVTEDHEGGGVDKTIITGAQWKAAQSLKLTED